MNDALFPCLRRGKLVVEFDGDDYLKAYVHPPDDSPHPIVTYGLQGRVRDEVWDGFRKLVDEYVEANRD